LKEWIKSLASPVPTVLGTLATIATILLLVALSRDPAINRMKPLLYRRCFTS
jgi:hypothetical protein